MIQLSHYCGLVFVSPSFVFTWNISNKSFTIQLLHHKKQLWSTHIRITIYFPLKPSLTAMTLRGPIEKIFQRSGPKLRKTRARMTRTSWSPTCRRWLQTVKITVLLSWLYSIVFQNQGRERACHCCENVQPCLSVRWLWATKYQLKFSPHQSTTACRSAIRPPITSWKY